MIELYRWFPLILKAITIIRPQTLVRWHRAGFRRYWRWKSRSLGGRPQIDADLRALIRRISVDNPLWGAPRIHGELLKLGFEIAQSSVAKYMVKRRGPPSLQWRTFLSNHAPDIAAMDLFVIPTIGLDLLYAIVIVRLARRDLVWINVTANPTAELSGDRPGLAQSLGIRRAILRVRARHPQDDLHHQRGRGAAPQLAQDHQDPRQLSQR